MMQAMISFFTLLSVIPATFAITHHVDVGTGGTLTFTPEQITAQVGDTVNFTFHPKNHSVTQSSFDSPCSPLSGGFDSGFIPVASGTSDEPFTVNVSDTKPIWIFCKQGSHCQQGMVFAINAGTTQSFEAFKAKATGSSTPTTTSATSTSTPSGHTSYKILVATNGSLTFSPANITAVPGDTVLFEFTAGNHTATQSSFDNPCQPLSATSFNSGFQPVNATGITPNFTITVNDTSPIWGFCAQGKHCEEGMVFAINAPTNDPTHSFDKFVQNAKQSNGSTSATSSSTASSTNPTSTSPTSTTNSASTSTATTNVTSTTTSPTNTPPSSAGTLRSSLTIVIAAVFSLAVVLA